MTSIKLTIDKLKRFRIWIQGGISYQEILVQGLSNIISEVTNGINSCGLIIQFHKTMVFYFVGMKANQVPGGIADCFSIEGNFIMNIYTTVDEKKNRVGPAKEAQLKKFQSIKNKQTQRERFKGHGFHQHSLQIWGKFLPSLSCKEWDMKVPRRG